MGKENVIHLHDGLLFTAKENKILKFTGMVGARHSHPEWENPEPERQILYAFLISGCWLIKLWIYAFQKEEPQRLSGWSGTRWGRGNLLRTVKVNMVVKDIKGKPELGGLTRSGWERRVKGGIWRGTTNTESLLENHIDAYYYRSIRKYTDIWKRFK